MPANNQTATPASTASTASPKPRRPPRRRGPGRRPRRRLRRMSPPWRRLLIRRRGYRPEHSETNQQQNDKGDDREPHVLALSDRPDREERQERDEQECRAERDVARVHQYTGIRGWT